MSFISLLVEDVQPVMLVRLSAIYSKLQENSQCQEKVRSDCFEIIDCASSYFRLQIKEAVHINWKKLELNKQVKHVGITISI